MHGLDEASFWPRLGAGLLAASLTWAAACCLGSRLISLALPSAGRSTRWALSAALGYGLIGSMVALLGALHLLYPQLVALMPACILALGARRILAVAADIPAKVRLARQRLLAAEAVAKMALLVIACALATAIIAAALPAVWWDPLAYHLPIVADMLAQHTLVFNPGLTQSGFPLLAECAALPAYALGSSAGAAMVTIFAGLVAALMAREMAEAIALGSGLLATALVVSSPLWLWLSPSFYVDVPFAMFVLSALLVSLTASGRVGDRKVSVLCGMLSGCAAATKLPGLADGLLILFVLGWAAKKQWVDAARWFLAAFAATAAGWYLRSYVVSGDPVYPFLSSHVGATAAIRLFAARYTFMTRHWCGGGTSLGDAVALPWRLLSDPRHYCGDPGFALRAGIVLFGLAILRRRRSLPLAGITFALTALWFVGSQQQRFFLPALFAYATLVAVGATCLTDRLRPVLTSALLALGVFAVASNWTPSLLRIASNSIVPAFAYIEGKQAAADYLSSRLESFDTARYSRSQLAPDARLVLLDDVRGYYFPSAVWGNPFYQPVWHLDWTASAGKRYRSLVARRIRYIVVNANPAYVGRTPHDIEWKVLAADSRSKAITALYSSDGVTLYEIMRSAQ